MIKYLVMDVDGTLTDGKIYMGSDGEVMKAFSVKDGYVINFILRPADIIPVIITARTSRIVQKRCEELGIREVYQGRKDKLTALKEIVGEDNLGRCAYFGDDILDLECMDSIKEAGGIAGCPADAVREVKAAVDYICLSKAGEGALREFSEWITCGDNGSRDMQERVNFAVEYLRNLNVTEMDVGKHTVNEDFFYYVQSYRTRPAKECRLESHREYIDVQVMVEGIEAVELADVCRLSAKEEYNSENDVTVWEAPSRMARTVLREGDYIILYPENAHRGGVAVDKVRKVLKVVGKVRYMNFIL